MKYRAQKGLRHGLYVPNFGKSGHPRVLAGLAKEAEKSGWDGFFLWDHPIEWNKPIPVYETFTSLSAIAANTHRIRIGTSITPLPKYKPWIFARKTATLDHLSDGRLTLGVGLGADESTDYARFGEDSDSHLLGERLNEALEVVTGLWLGRTFSHKGKHFNIKSTVFRPTPVQKPRIPIWTGGLWPHKAPFRRAARWDGIIPLKAPGRLLQPNDLREIVEYVIERRKSDSRFDIANIGWTTGVNREKDRKKVQLYEEAGMTWWLESMWTKRDSPEKMRERIRKGPPT
jgi:alkanesulfonate monooxygenase SsuD/methylene tetrahydromethanopterin reductase-like flavin-dependent oxidoreductase (luciferase family)